MVVARCDAYGLSQGPAAVPDQPRHDMSRYERDQFFAALCTLRDAYACLSDDDRRSSLMIEDAVTCAEAVMQALHAADTAADVAADAAFAAETIRSGDVRN
jgi:hypothetical protein